MTWVTVAIASMGRPSLAETLACLAAQRLPAGTRVEVIVADDSRDGAAARLVADGAFAARVLPVGAGNVSIARNACLAEARGDLVAMIDDDETVGETWLAELMAEKAAFAASAIVAPVDPVYPAGTPEAIVRANPLYTDWGRRGRRVITGRSGNVLFERAIVERAHLRFDPAFGRTGGEDTDFFHRYHLAGGQIVVTDRARAREQAAPGRLDPNWLRRRALRGGQSYASFRLAGGRGLGPRGLAFHGGALAKALAAFAVAVVLRPFDAGASLANGLKGWRNLGKLRQLTGWPLPGGW